MTADPADTVMAAVPVNPLLAADLAETVAAGSLGLALPIAVAAGVVSFLSPCVLPLVPAYVSYVAGETLSGKCGAWDHRRRLPVLGLGLLFVLGFSTVFVILGASATALGQLLCDGGRCAPSARSATACTCGTGR